MVFDRVVLEDISDLIKMNYPNIGFRFVTPSFTHITKYVYDECMKELAELIESYCHRNIAIRSLMISTQNMDKTSQMNLFFGMKPNISSAIRPLIELIIGTEKVPFRPLEVFTEYKEILTS